MMGISFTPVLFCSSLSLFPVALPGPSPSPPVESGLPFFVFIIIGVVVLLIVAAVIVVIMIVAV